MTAGAPERRADGRAPRSKRSRGPALVAVGRDAVSTSSPLTRRARGPHPLGPYRTAVVAIDWVMVLLATGIGFVTRLGAPDNIAYTDVGYLMATVTIPLAWILVLILVGAYDIRILGVGSEEFKRVVTAGLIVLGVVATVSYLLRAEFSRGFVLVAIPLGLILVSAGRWGARRWLHRARSRGQYLHRTLVVGTPQSAADLTDTLEEDLYAGFRVVDALPPPDGDGHEELDRWLDEVMLAIETRDADAVAIAHSGQVGSEVVRRLAWRLEGPRVDLLVAPAIGDVSGPRVQVRPAAGLPLLQLYEPRLTGPSRVVKRSLDIVVSATALVGLAPLFAVVAIIVKTTSRGPVLFVQDRVGQAGDLFRFPKFRTMVIDAHAQRPEVLGRPDDEMAARYRTDPRITPVGRVLRRWSLDELPQLWTVFRGRMSLVGPRPMLIEEVPLLGDVDHRRHLTKPGLTGLWQVSGRKTVDWDERMRMDLYYVEQWSPALDLVILFKTFRAVISGYGAY